MAGSRKKRERQHRLEAMLGDPTTLRQLCDFLVEGGTLLEWTRKHDVPYTDVAAWLTAEDHRRDKWQAALTLRGEYLSDMVIRNLRMFADLDWGKAYDKAGELLSVPKMPEDLRRALTAFEVTEEFEGRGESREQVGITKKIRGIAPEKAVELLGKYRKMFIDQHEVKGKLTLEQLVGASMQPDPATAAAAAPPANEPATS